MLQKNLIEFFLAQPIIAVVGVSREGNSPGNHIYKKFKELDYVVYPVNPKAARINGDKCYPNLYKVPLTPTAVLLAGPPESTEGVILDCIALHIPIVWMHRGIGTGSFSQEADMMARANGIQVIDNGCPLMFLGNVDPFHKVLKWFK